MEKSYRNSNGKHQETYNKLWEELVPHVGAAETKEGELLRAIVRIYYRWYNDGDRIERTLQFPAYEYGAFNAWNFIRKFQGQGDKIDFKKLTDEFLNADSDDAYEEILEKSADAIIEYVAQAPRTPNDDDFQSDRYKDLPYFMELDDECECEEDEE